MYLLPEILFNYFQNNFTIVTPNNRLSKQLLTNYYTAQNHQVIDKPICVPYPTFLQNLFQDLRHQSPFNDHPVLISGIQQRYLWQLVLKQNGLNSAGILDKVQEAWVRCQNFELDILHAEFENTPQTHQFQSWSMQFLEQLTQLNAITEEQIIAYLCQQELTYQAPGVVWVCFDDFTPAQRTLQTLLAAHGIIQHFYDNTISNTTALCYAAADEQDENLQWINFAKERILAKDQQICIVIPELETKEKSLKRLINAHFSPNQVNLSLGSALLEYPMIAHAFTGLHLNKNYITREQMQILLHSPYFAGSKTEYLSRAHAWVSNPTWHEAYLPFNTFLQTLPKNTTQLSKCLTALTSYPENATPLQWIEVFKQRLNTLGFPGEYSYNSIQYQCFQRFMQLFDEFLQLSLITPAMSGDEALEALTTLAKNTLFQAQQNKNAPVHILGLLEASGCVFDSIWIMGLTDECLPQKTRLSAFIPLQLQRDYQMPHALAERELTLAKKQLHRFQLSSNLSIYSYPQWCGDLPNLPSPLIVSLPTFTPSSNIPHVNVSALVAWQDLDNLPMLENEAITGGTSLLANQAKCPFRAFAAHRLHARPIDSITDGLSSKERGEILHRIMENIWRKLQCQDTLLAYPHDKLTILINTTIQGALEPFKAQKPFSFSPLIQDIEQQRLSHLVTACLEWDKQRPAFIIEELEKAYDLVLGELSLKVRIDRLDYLQNTAEKLLIDYKTTLPTTLPWDDERLEAPQLPLYTLLDDAICAVLFLQLKTGRLKARGLSANTSVIKGLQAPSHDKTWEDYKDCWREKLTELAYEFKNGHCQITPYRENTCINCEYSSLCRIKLTERN